MRSSDWSSDVCSSYLLVRDEAGFEQHRRGIGRLQHDEGGEAVRGGAEFDLVGRLALEQPREVGGEVHRLALGEVEQDRRYVAAVRAEVDAIDDVDRKSTRLNSSH